MKAKLALLMMTIVLACINIRAQDTIAVVQKKDFNAAENVAARHKDKDFDKAICKWVNDITLIFKLTRSSENKSESFRMAVNGDRSGLSLEWQFVSKNLNI